MSDQPNLDSRLETAARQVRDHVSDYAVPALDPGRGPHRGRRNWAPTAVFVVLVLLAGGVVAAAGDSSDGSDEVADAERPSPAVDEATEESFEEVGTAVGGPRDGKDSLQLPVEVSPAAGLADGQVVTVSGSQFPPGVRLGIVMCAIAGPAGPGAGVENCDTTTVDYADSDAEGTFTAEYAVDRDFVAAGVAIDCATTPPPEGQQATCAIAVGALDDYDQSGYAHVEFDPDLPLLPDPSVEISPAEGFVDGQEVTVTVRHVTPGSEWTVQQCLRDHQDHYVCVVDAGHPGGEPRYHGTDVNYFTADETGTATGTFVVRRKVEGPQGPLDCMAEPHQCYLEVGGPDLYESVPLVFGGPPAEERPAPPTAPATTPGTAPPEATDTTLAPTTTVVPSAPSTTAPSTTVPEESTTTTSAS